MVKILLTENEKRIEMRKKLIVKLLPVVRKEGIASLRTDNMAKYMDVSKATMYKYFSSKEDIMECIVDLYVDYILDIDEVIFDENASLSDRFQKSFQQSLLIAFYISDTYLAELQAYSAELYEKIAASQEQRNSRLTLFYKQYAEQGIFNDINPSLMILQDSLLLRKLVDPAVLASMNITLYQALFDYYLLKKQQLIHVQHLQQIDDTNIQETLKKLMLKFSVSM
jgi:AcrR family transcriptional regulator